MNKHTRWKDVQTLVVSKSVHSWSLHPSAYSISTQGIQTGTGLDIPSMGTSVHEILLCVRYLPPAQMG